MAVVRPLEALRYDPARAGDVGSLLAPPYDVITPSEQAELHARSPYNVIRLILSQEADRAAAAARTLRDWVERGILVRARTPAVYLSSQRFSLPDGTTRRRDGLLCRLRLEEYARGIVRRHERTLAAPKVERLAVLRATGANLSPIFGLYARPREPVRELVGPVGEPVIDVNGWHQLWRVTDPAAIARVEAALARLAALPAALRTLDVELLHQAILEPILGADPAALEFTHDDDEAADAVRTGRAAAAFLLNPPSMAAVRAVCLAGELMREKSTYFYPKLATGLVLSLVGPPRL